MNRNEDMAESERTYLWTSPFFGKQIADRVRFAMTLYSYRKSQVADVSSFVILVPLGDG